MSVRDQWAFHSAPQVGQTTRVTASAFITYSYSCSSENRRAARVVAVRFEDDQPTSVTRMARNHRVVIGQWTLIAAVRVHLCLRLWCRHDIDFSIAVALE